MDLSFITTYKVSENIEDSFRFFRTFFNFSRNTGVINENFTYK